MTSLVTAALETLGVQADRMPRENAFMKPLVRDLAAALMNG